MDQKSMTALVSAFSRGYHAANNEVKIFDDVLAFGILTEEEKRQIALSMSGGIKFFNPAFCGTQEQALRWIVDNQLSPLPLGRAAWAEKAVETAVRIGAAQYLIIAAGCDTFAYRQPEWAKKLKIFELDHPYMSADKQKRVQRINAGKPENLYYIPVDLAEDSLCDKLRACTSYDNTKLSFCSLLGISYYISKDTFGKLIADIADSVPDGSTVVFDYFDEFAFTEQAGERAKKQLMLADGAGETMLAGYSYAEMTRLLSGRGFLIYGHLTPAEITEQYFYDYNKANPGNIITGFDNANYCLAVKK